ncbi:capsule assembly Wzi family protein [Aureibacter tunicatorum]|uniref:Capsule assembly protein Wzi n=1 Tax=Aureibacter tunicatorum TaxID=866807 RepID=A0AAE4BTN9_9BACT|nr:capsule assembly Wzi family protein [Aureibacter tunicatorum]MDR6240160.1 hypothetical protein [Aureibacter tunicatorum]BDD05959.1 hypothetical protein AUTU_34420 [Aureibacter tunicatorum]
MQKKHNLSLFILSFFFLSHQLSAQDLDSLKIEISSLNAFSSKGYLPLWMSANRHGLYDDSQANYILKGAIYGEKQISKKLKFSGELDLLLYNNSISQSRAQQAYLQLDYGKFRFWGGLKEHTMSSHAPDIGSGSFSISGNARPIPTIAFGFPEYTDLPWTNGFVQFKGMFEQSWLEKDRYISKAMLHSKNFYLKTNKLPVNLQVGMTHNVVFGGTHPVHGKLPPYNFKDYLTILIPAGNSGNSPIEGENTNQAGTHRGMFDFGLTANIKDWELTLYHQKPFEDLSGYIRFFEQNKDHFTGIVAKSKSKKIISEFTYEWIYTKWQSGPGLPDPNAEHPNNESNYGYRFGGRDDYYNSMHYLNGYTFHRYSIGTPLFITTDRANYYFDGNVQGTQYNEQFVSNRMIAHHLGIKGWLSKWISYRALFTYTENFGTYTTENNGRYNWDSMNPDRPPYNDGSTTYQFDGGLKQYYTMIEISSPLPFWKNMSAHSTFAYDFGELSHNFGMIIGIAYTL